MPDTALDIENNTLLNKANKNLHPHITHFLIWAQEMWDKLSYKNRMFIMLDDEKNKAVEKTGFRVWGVSQEVSLRRWFLSNVLSRCKTWSQGGERKREVMSKNSEKES